jgi:hypothetical protein
MVETAALHEMQDAFVWRAVSGESDAAHTVCTGSRELAMNTDNRIDRRMSPQEFAAVFDAAKAHALALRREAIRDFWLGVERALRRGFDAFRFSSVRFERGMESQ